MDGDRGGLPPIAAVREGACVLDPGRPCRACLAPHPGACPYLYLLGESGAVSGRPEGGQHVEVRHDQD